MISAFHLEGWFSKALRSWLWAKMMIHTIEVAKRRNKVGHVFYDPTHLSDSKINYSSQEEIKTKKG